MFFCALLLQKTDLLAILFIFVWAYTNWPTNYCTNSNFFSNKCTSIFYAFVSLEFKCLKLIYIQKQYVSNLVYFCPKNIFFCSTKKNFSFSIQVVVYTKKNILQLRQKRLFWLVKNGFFWQRKKKFFHQSNWVKIHFLFGWKNCLVSQSLYFLWLLKFLISQNHVVE